MVYRPKIEIETKLSCSGDGLMMARGEILEVELGDVPFLDLASLISAEVTGSTAAF